VGRVSTFRRGRARIPNGGGSVPRAPRRRRIGAPIALLTVGIFLLLFGSGHAAPPTVGTTGGALAYAENAPATAIDPGLTVSEPDLDLISTATVQITGNYVTGEDVLAYSPQGGISGSFNSGTGAIVLTGDATDAAYEAAMRTITYVNTSDNPSSATRTVTFLVTDVNTESGSNTRDIAVAPSDDPLSFTTTAGSLSYTEDSGAVAADSTLTVADPDSSIIGATVQITGNYQSAEDTLGFTNQLGITGSWNSGTGMLTLSGTTTPDDYETALRAVTYANSSNNPSTLPRTLTYIVSEAGGSASGTRVVAISALNDAPDAGGDTTVGAPGGGAVSVNEDTTAPGAANIRLTPPALTDAEGPTPSQVRVLTITGGTMTQGNGAAIGLGAGGSLLTLAGGGVDLRFTPTPDRDVDADFTYVVVDGANPGINSAASTATVPITPVNDAPSLSVSGGAAAFTENGGGVAVDGGASAADIDDTDLESATLQITANYANGEDMLNFTPQGGISGSWDSTTGTLTLSGTASIATYDTALQSVTFDNSNENPSAAARTVSISVHDGDAPSTTRTRTVTVTAVNDAPTAATSGGSASYTENAAPVALDTGITLADADSTDFDGASVTITGNYANGEDVLAFTNQAGISGAWNAGSGALTLSGTATIADYETALRSVTYVDTVDDPSTATRTVTIEVTDADGAPSAGATRDVDIIAVNDPPVVETGAGGITYTENDAPTAVAPAFDIVDVDDTTIDGATVALSANYWNGEDELAFTDQSGITGSWDATTGTLTLSGTAALTDYETALQSVTYENLSDDPSSAVRTIEVDVVDPAADPSNVDTRTVTVVPVNDSPSITTTGGTVTFTEGDPPTTVDGALAVTELDDPTLARARARIAAGYQSDEEHLSVTSAAGIAVDWDPTTGTLDLTGSGSAATYETILRSVEFHNGDDAPTTGNRTIEFRADDGAGFGPAATRVLDVVAVNDPPVARPDEVTVLQGGTVIVDVLANDTDADNPTVYLDSFDDPDDATVTVVRRKLKVVPDAGFTGPIRFDYTARAAGQTDTARVTVRVRPAADLSVKVSAGPTPSYTGGTITAFATVANAGPGTATDARVVLDMGGATVTKATTAGGDCTSAGDVATCHVPDLAKNGSALVSVNARAGVPGVMAVQATASSDATDTDSSDDRASTAVDVRSAPGFVAPPPVEPPPNDEPAPGETDDPDGSGGTDGTSPPAIVFPPAGAGTDDPALDEPRPATTTTTEPRDSHEDAGDDGDGATGGATDAPANDPRAGAPGKEPATNSPIGPAFFTVLAVGGSVIAIVAKRLVRAR
jgi:hypothetical protein